MNKTNTRKALSPAYRKHKPLRKDVNEFVYELTNCLSSVKLIVKQGESEEHIKDPIILFLQNTCYKENYINTKDKIDLAIYNGKDITSDVSVLIEVKRPSNTTEFLSKRNLRKTEATVTIVWDHVIKTDMKDFVYTKFLANTMNRSTYVFFV